MTTDVRTQTTHESSIKVKPEHLHRPLVAGGGKSSRHIFSSCKSFSFLNIFSEKCRVDVCFKMLTFPEDQNILKKHQILRQYRLQMERQTDGRGSDGGEEP